MLINLDFVSIRKADSGSQTSRESGMSQNGCRRHDEAIWMAALRSSGHFRPEYNAFTPRLASFARARAYPGGAAAPSVAARSTPF